MTDGNPLTGHPVDELERLWGELGDVAIDDDEAIDRDWHWYPAGTSRYEIWRDFDEAHSAGVHALMYHDENSEPKEQTMSGKNLSDLSPVELEGAYREYLGLQSDGDGRTVADWREFSAGTACDEIADAFEELYPSGTDGLEHPERFSDDRAFMELRNIKLDRLTADVIGDADPAHMGALLNTAVGKLSPVFASGQRSDGLWAVSRTDGTPEGTRARVVESRAEAGEEAYRMRDEAKRLQTTNLLRSGRCFFTTDYLPNDRGPIGFAFITFAETRDYRAKGDTPGDYSGRGSRCCGGRHRGGRGRRARRVRRRPRGRFGVRREVRPGAIAGAGRVGRGPRRAVI